MNFRRGFRGVLSCRHGHMMCTFILLGVVILLFGFSGDAAAQEAEEFTLEDTVVTATKTGETDLQVTPISITAFTEEMLQNSHAYRLNELTEFIPNAQFDIDGPVILGYIRGVGSSETFIGGEPAVGFYLDGVYLDKGLGARPDFVDVERIEVLRGPQGSLYGRNSTGGALNIITKRASDELELTAGVELGNYSKRRIDFGISGPIVKDKVNARISFSDSKRDGFVEDLGPGGPLFDENYTGVRGQVEITATDKVDIRFAADYFDSDAHMAPTKFEGEGGLITNVLAPAAGIPTEALYYDDHWTTAHNDANQESVENWGIHGYVDWELSENMAFHSITAYRELDYAWVVDIDGTLVTALTSRGREIIDQFSQEFQLSGTSDRWNYVVGAFYYHSTTDWPDMKVDIAFAPPGPGQGRDIMGGTTTDSYALFANATYALTDKLSIEGGARYTYEEKEVNFSDEWRIFFGPPGLNASLEDDWNDFSPKIGLHYEATDEAFLFATISKGFRAGSFFPQNPPGTDPRVDAEEVWNYEAGVKTDWLDNRLRANLTGFYMDYSDIWTETLSGPFVLNSNASEAEIKGFELEMLARPVSALTLNSSLSYLDAKYSDTVIVNNALDMPVDANGNYLPRAPEWKFVFGAQYVIPVGDVGFLTLRGDLSWIDEYYYQIHNDLWEDSHTFVNGLVRFETADGRWSAEVYGKNLGDEEAYSHKSPLFGPETTVQPKPPATYGVQVFYKF